MILRELAARLGCTLRGDGDVDVRRVRAIDDAGPGDLTFVSSPRYVPRLAATRASAVIVTPALETPLPSLLAANPYLAFARAVALLHPQPPAPAGVHPSAVVDPTAELGEGVHVGPLAVIGPRARVGARSVIHPHVVIYPEAQVGEDCLLYSGVQIRERCRLGHRVIVQNGAVIGGDGFGFAKDEEGRYEKILQVGTVVVEDDVEIGALTAVDRAALGETRIGRGTKIDNLVQIGHSVTIGRDSVLAGQVGIAGSARLGDRVTLAGQVGVVGHISIGDGAVVTAQSGIPGPVEPGGLVSGSPAIDNRTWLKATAVFAKLPALQKRVRELERRLEELTRK
ncbi:MAG: UDP-3-O-(3-hydroxymyristoyl)glucosamine N-acyltransferase [Acidobacteria bacterium]|nr:MAG: UDP-3-O-(3-hydroxymyristoyl)glucosamine N-acyltransferase [Acidobacteriota bacterium]PYQ24962.1 MAG: UDP-3-O-(3-hydroxymyristoyl)glucosamine N-acyltransferase [Acidobacteriota bacterium]